MKSSLRRSRLTVTLSGLGLLAVGLAVLLNPIGALEDGVAMIGWILVIVGALTLLGSVLQAGLPPQRNWCDLGVAALEIVPGIVMVAVPGSLVDAVWVLLGAYVLVTGVHTVVDARGVGARVAGCVVALLGSATIAAALAGQIFGMLAACPALVVAGVIELLLGLRLSK